jgi:hypothetical protein
MKKIISLFAIAGSLFAQNFTGGFNFYQSSTDTSTQKFLPQFPKKAIGDNDFVKIDANGKFSVNGNRIRFWGTNNGTSAAFPPKANAELMAGRLRKFGFNLIRLHHMDNPGWGISLLTQTSTRTLNQTSLDLLENYIAKLKDNGVYVNVNLHVSRTFVKNDGVANYDSIPDMGKITNFIDPYMMTLHKEYASQLLTHVNPYTKKSLVNDPVMAMVEITNENSLYRSFRNNELKPVKNGGILPYRYSRMLDSLWIEFLKKKYVTNTVLQNSWNNGSFAAGTGEKITNGGFENGTAGWSLELHSPAAGLFSIDKANPFAGTASGKIVVSNSTGTDWHIQFKQSTVSLKKDSTYTVTFAAKADLPQNVSVSLMNENDPWTWYGGKSILLTNSWQLFSFSVKAGEDNLGHCRISFALGKNTGTYWLDNVSVAKAASLGLLTDESLDSKFVRRVDYADCIGYTNKRVKDLTEFYITLERNYFKEMISYLKTTLGVKVPILSTNWNVGIVDLAAMSDGEYVDNHAYWDHPQFPKTAWSNVDWLINNKPMVKDVDGSTIPNLFTSVPTVGKPFTVSEYNHPFPNQYQVESVLFTTGYSSFNDADALMYFDYDEVSGWGSDMIGKNSYFNVSRNSAYMSLFPAAAYAFRNNLIKPSVNPVFLNYSADTLYSIAKNDIADWRGPNFVNTKIGLVNAVKTQTYFAPVTSSLSNYQAAPASPYKTDTNEIVWNTTDGTITIAANSFNGAAGYLAKLKNTRFGNIYVVDFNSDDFGAVTWLTLTNKKSLITIASKTQNANMIWDGTQSLHENWGNTPTSVYPLRLKLDLQIYADSVRVYPLDATGKENSQTSFIVKPSITNHFTFDFDQAKYKTLWFGLEYHYFAILPGINDTKTVPSHFKLEQNYPNPFNPSTTIGYSIPNPEWPGGSRTSLQHVTLKVFDVLGREVATLVNELKQPGNYSEKLHATFIPSGIYFYKLTAGNFTETKKMILMK